MSYVPSSRCRHMLRTLESSTALFTSLLIAAAGLTGNIAASAQELPQGGTVASGNVTITQTAPTAMVINQTSGTAVTNWQSFSIGQGNSVAVVQPSTSSAMLARVNGNTTSTIAGSLSATGQFMLINPNGISITATGTVNAGGGFVATTLGISDDDFLSGKRIFKGNGASGAVSNDGAITVGPGGYAALIGGTVSNSGTISVPMGKVGLGSGEIATLDFSGDGFLQVGVPTAAPGKGALVSNAGKITANGGSVHIKAAQARDAARQAINMSGVIEARSVSGSNGNITLGGSEGEVAVSGKLDASSASGKGGTVRVTGRQIKLSGGSIDASGKTGGGTVRIGGDRQGAGTLPRAAKVAVDKTTIIRADATDQGNGGDVVIWSDSRTDFAGTITARGGANGGNGGEAEVSSKGVLGYSGLTVLTAAKGTTGTLLLDPYNITISNAADTGGFTASADDSVINVTTLQTALASANVTISTGSSGSQAGDITVAAPLTWSANLLRLDAAHSIKIASTVTVGGTGALMLNTNVGGGLGGTLDFGLTSSGFAGRIDFTGTPGQQALFFNMAQQTLIYSLADLQNVNNDLSGNYMLARNLDASGTTYTDALIGVDNTSAFTGKFDGLGHTISNLAIIKPQDYSGLFGAASGATIGNVGLVGGSLSGRYFAGSLLGYGANTTIASVFSTSTVQASGSGAGALVGELHSNSAISNAYATGTVSAHDTIGGLVGAVFDSAVSNAYATGAVGGLEGIGGLVGFTRNATISQVHAAGAARGNQYIGGLIGYSDSMTLSQAYSTGAVAGSINVGGLVGKLVGGTIASAYWDVQTSGRTNGIGTDGNSQSGNVTGLTTAQLQNGTSASGLGNAFTVSANLYPYLTSFFPNGVQAISGIAYDDSGVTRFASDANAARYVYIDIAGRQTAVTTGANGYYYAMLSGGTLSSANGGTAVVAYTRDGNVTGAVMGAHLRALSGTAQNLDVWANNLIAPTAATSLSTAETSVNALLGANANRTLLTDAAGGDTVPTDANAGVADLGLVGYIATSGSGFTIDRGISAYGLYVKAATGPITVSSAQTLGGPINLTLLSSGDLDINAAVQVNGNGALTLGYGGKLNMAMDSSGFAGSLTFANADGTVATLGEGGTLTVNDKAYTLVYSLTDLQNINNNLSGTYALAHSLDASGQTYSNALVGQDLGTSFTGTFDGLGHTIGNLVIAKSGDYAGLFGSTANATIRNIGLAGGSVTGNSYAGGLAGQAQGGSISNAYGTGSVSGHDNVGGLVGTASAAAISNAYATGAVSGTNQIGGLVGDTANNATVSNAHATGDVSGASSIGGLVGRSFNSTIGYAYATGAVSGTNGVGGLVAYSVSSTISNAYATGAVNGTGFYVGGLVGSASMNTISDAYATGAVHGFSDIGGFAGGVSDSSISNIYATGAVNGAVYVGGLFGEARAGSITNALWDTQTSGRGSAIGDGSQIANVTGLTTAQLQDGTSAAGLGSAFTVSVNLYPYLTSFFPNGAKAISGFAYKDTGVTPLASGANGAGLVNVRFGSGGVQTISTGANGYYYAMAAADGSPSPVLAYTRTDTTTGAANGAFFLTDFTGTLSGVSISAGWRIDAALAGGTLSALDTAYATATAGTTAAGMTLANRAILGIGTFMIDTPLTVSGKLELVAGLPGTTFSQTSALSADTLILRSPNGQSRFMLTGSGNRFNNLAASGTDVLLDVYDASDLTITTSASDPFGTAVSGITLLNSSQTVARGVRVATAGNLKIASGAAVHADNPVLAAGGTFTNNAGANAVSAIAGRWLVYAADPTGNTFGGLDSQNTAVWGTSYPTAVTAQGNRYVFARQATLTVTARDAEKSAGETSGFNGYTVSGFQGGVAGAFLGDDPAGLTGLPGLSSAGAAANAAPGTYEIAIAHGSLIWGGYGYGFNFVSGKLTVNGSSQPDPTFIFAPGSTDSRPDGFGASTPGGGFSATDPSNLLNLTEIGFDKANVCFPGRACE
ncbi:filamentous hemagglutinin family protein [Rhizobium aquaticum]|uniref:Filamentous hemagglutinin family protein n=1 Tax=Rhizobium aquaticum TaxID=1549636 RepID=A0ABV2J0H9_9HYPH